jgi:hypothetical protein
MYIGHYAIAIGASSLLEKRRGVLTYIAFSSLLPDTLMLLSKYFGYSYEFHSLKSQVICSLLIIAIGLVYKFNLKTFIIAISSTFFHIVCDIPYSGEENNLYSHHKLDFTFEITLLILGCGLYFYKMKKNTISLFNMISLFLSLAFLQGLWNFLLSA